MKRPRGFAACALAVCVFGAGCSSAPLPEFVTGTWANANVVMVAAGDSLTLKGGSYGLTVHAGLLTQDGAFTLRGELALAAFGAHQPVTVSGAVSGSTITLTMRPGIVDSVDHYSLALDAALPDWYPNGAPCQV